VSVISSLSCFLRARLRSLPLECIVMLGTAFAYKYRLRWRGLMVTKTLAYYGTEIITSVKNKLNCLSQPITSTVVYTYKLRLG
jgi:hypothetical protein